MKRTGTITAAMGLIAGFALAAPSAAQVDINARAGLGVPTFDIDDAADPGFNVGGGIAIGLTERLFARGNVDFGFHPGANDGPDVDVRHYIAGVGLLLTDPANPFYISVNLGAGALNFDIDVEGVESTTSFAINAGAEIGYWVSEQFSIFASPQGDIAFTDEAELGTDNAWVWPFTAGIKVRLGN
ncbi:MAG: outer membrane beta-barrel protein [Gemmatimonadota bacterium]|nr:outer membrane beta-barrel protein [Gemmatimonadota bacterium]